jgi:hypothetical protein
MSSRNGYFVRTLATRAVDTSTTLGDATANLVAAGAPQGSYAAEPPSY